MRVLLIGAAPVVGSVELVARLAAECDVVVAVDGGVSIAEAAGVRYDVALGDFDSLSAREVAELEAGSVSMIRFPAEKDASDLDLALDHARGIGATEVIVTAAFSGRLDHTLCSVGSVARAADLVPRIEEPTMSGWVLSAARRPSLAACGEGSTLSLIAALAPSVVSVTGVRWPLDRATLVPLSSLGLSNLIVESEARVAVESGVVVACLFAAGLV